MLQLLIRHLKKIEYPARIMSNGRNQNTLAMNSYERLFRFIPSPSFTGLTRFTVHMNTPMITQVSISWSQEIILGLF